MSENGNKYNIKKGLISVIVPIYNVEKYLVKCLDSIKAQTYTNIEVILVNDGSLDNSGSIAELFAKEDERYIYISKENGGLSSARNEGIKRATGEYIFFLDSDDWIKKDYLEKLLQEFDQETDIVIGKYTLDDGAIGRSYIPYESENISESFKEEEKEKQVIERHLNAYPGKGYTIKNTLMPVWKNLYRSELLRNNNISFVNERLVGAEDYVFNFEAYYYARKIRFSSVAGCMHVIVEGSLSRSFCVDNINRGFNRYEVVKKSIEQKTFYNKEAVLYALECEKLRIILGVVYSIATSDLKDKIMIIKQILSDNEVKCFLRDFKKPNLGKKYLLVLYLLKLGGIRGTCVLLKLVKRKYRVYRQAEYKMRK